MEDIPISSQQRRENCILQRKWPSNGNRSPPWTSQLPPCSEIALGFWNWNCNWNRRRRWWGKGRGPALETSKLARWKWWTATSPREWAPSELTNKSSVMQPWPSPHLTHSHTRPQSQLAKPFPLFPRLFRNQGIKSEEKENVKIPQAIDTQPAAWGRGADKSKQDWRWRGKHAVEERTKTLDDGRWRVDRASADLADKELGGPLYWCAVCVSPPITH